MLEDSDEILKSGILINILKFCQHPYEISDFRGDDYRNVRLYGFVERKYLHCFILNLMFEVGVCFEKLVPPYETKWPHISDDKNYNPFTLRTQSNTRVKEIIGVCGTLIFYMFKADGAHLHILR